LTSSIILIGEQFEIVLSSDSINENSAAFKESERRAQAMIMLQWSLRKRARSGQDSEEKPARRVTADKNPVFDSIDGFRGNVTSASHS
jgi:hypothetical protein